jgi:diguanylate cyclase (GGDEF)-like protein
LWLEDAVQRLKWPNWLAGGPATPPEVRVELVRALFADNTSIPSGALAIVLTAACCSARLGSVWPLYWLLAAIPCFIHTLRVIALYKRDPSSLTPEVWTRRLAVGNWARALLWGLAGAVVGFVRDPFVNMVIIGVQAGYVSVASTRYNASPALAVGMVALALVPTMVGLLACGDGYMMAFALFAILHMMAAIGNIRQLSGSTLRLLSADRQQALLVSDLARVNGELESANANLVTLSMTDQLTGVVNRRGFEHALEAAWKRSYRESRELSLLMIDVDHFKRFNDSYGHVEGDACLRSVARAITAAVTRECDIICRYGGEEFAVILDLTNSEGTRLVGERIRRSVASLDLPHSGSAIGHVSISVGCATTIATGKHFADLITMADTALYEAKRAGRNRVQSFDGPAPLNVADSPTTGAADPLGPPLSGAQASPELATAENPELLQAK